MNLLTCRVAETVSESVYGDLGLVKCDPVKITLKQDAMPYSVARRIPLPLLPKVKQELFTLKRQKL
jgi:hypothetical protein